MSATARAAVWAIDAPRRRDHDASATRNTARSPPASPMAERSQPEERTASAAAATNTNVPATNPPSPSTASFTSRTAHTTSNAKVRSVANPACQAPAGGAGKSRRKTRKGGTPASARSGTMAAPKRSTRPAASACNAGTQVGGGKDDLSIGAAKLTRTACAPQPAATPVSPAPRPRSASSISVTRIRSPWVAPSAFITAMPSTWRCANRCAPSPIATADSSAVSRATSARNCSARSRVVRSSGLPASRVSIRCPRSILRDD